MRQCWGGRMERKDRYILGYSLAELSIKLCSGIVELGKYATYVLI